VPDDILAQQSFLEPHPRATIFFISKGLCRTPFNLKFTKDRYGMSGEIRYSGAASGWSG
jgi:hypothetical protein